jgi:hypothetical protein
MTTPNYKGKAQPTANSGGWFGNLGSWFSGPKPAYTAAKGQSGYLGGMTPAYKPAPTNVDGANTPEAIEADAECATGPERITVLIPRELIEQQKSE